MKSTVILFLTMVWIFTISSSAQEYKNIDSLLAVYHNRPNDTTKIRIGTLVLQNLTYTNPEKAYKYAHQMVRISKEINYEHGVGLGYNQLGSYFLNKDELDSAQYYHQATLDVVTRSQNIGGILTANNRFAVLLARKNEFKEAEEYLKKSIELFENRDTIAVAREIDFKYIGSTFYELSEMNLRRGRYNLALKHGLRSLELYQERAGDPLFEADAYTLLGQIEMKMTNYEQSIIHFNQAYKVYEEFKDLLWACDALRHIGENMLLLHRADEAVEYLKNSIKIADENRFQLKEAAAHDLLGNAYITLNKFPEARESLNRSLEVYSEMDNPTEINKTYSSLGLLYNKMNQPEAAISHLEKAIVISDSLRSLADAAESYLRRSESFIQLRDYQAAYQDFSKYNELNDSIFNIRKSEQIEEMRAIFDIETKEQQIALQNQEISLLEQKAEIGNLQRLVMGIGLLLSIIGFYAIRQKMKRNRAEKQRVDAELAFKKKELTTHALHLAKKNEVLERVIQKARELKLSQNQGGYEQLIRTINFDKQDDKNWENFTQYFEQVHKDFSKNVKSLYPEVTKNELRFMALLKMNMSSKEIAIILNVSADGIKKARQRLRKKMGLNPKESLENTVMQI
ncbi:tetratricopeptide repeat protein [Poritiphilus flavus]|uniref:Tetratricopeptide repeat protein n=1 Tax=Poritiphilus flavus TaxID=2697053 RepID=A0A6L9EBC4_9FLAO|nr:tetratricopeptide repeat protein [Poritiphilus flavus]NAS12010.1 tetratricopeptide repeat protein [Poritiphilus flavus]